MEDHLIKNTNATLDHGLQYFSKTKTFDHFLKQLIKFNILKTGRAIILIFLSGIDYLEKIIGKHGNNDLCKYLVKKINTKSRRNFLNKI